jgi:hypothetical protein
MLDAAVIAKFIFPPLAHGRIEPGQAVGLGAAARAMTETLHAGPFTPKLVVVPFSARTAMRVVDVVVFGE